MDMCATQLCYTLKLTFYFNKKKDLTPSYNETGDEQGLARHEGGDYYGMQVQAFAKHPEKVTSHQVLRHHVQGLAPNLGLKTQVSSTLVNTNIYQHVNGKQWLRRI